MKNGSSRGVTVSSRSIQIVQRIIGGKKTGARSERSAFRVVGAAQGQRFHVAITKTGVGAAIVPETLRAGITPGLKIGIAGIRKGRPHEFICAAGKLAVPKNHRFCGAPHDRAFCGHRRSFLARGGLAFALPVTNVTGVVIVAGKRVVAPIGLPGKRWALLDLRIGLPLPKQAGNDMAIGIRGEIPAKGNVVRVGVIGKWIGVAVIASINLRRDSHLPQIIHTLDGFRPGLGAAQGRQQNRRQQGDNRHHHQEFNQGEPPVALAFGGQVARSTQCMGRQV